MSRRSRDPSVVVVAVGHVRACVAWPGRRIIVAAMQGTRKAAERLAWDDVRLFLALCRARTLGAAPAEVGVDDSTVSRRLAAMEEALSATLFDRGRNGITPTEAAEALMPVAEEIAETMARFASEAEGLERAILGLVRVACPPDLAEVTIAPLVPALRERHPALHLEILPGETVLDLTRREADLALRTVRPVRGDLVVTRIGSVRWVLVAAPDLARALGTLRAWEDAPWVGFGERLSSIAPARWLATHARGAEPVVRSDSLTLQIALARRGVVVALVPEPSVAHYAGEDRGAPPPVRRCVALGRALPRDAPGAPPGAARARGVGPAARARRRPPRWAMTPARHALHEEIPRRSCPPRTGRGGRPRVVREVPRRPAQRALHAVHQPGVAAVQDLREQVGDERDVVGRYSELAEHRRVLLDRDRQVPDRPAGRRGDLVDRLNVSSRGPVSSYTPPRCRSSVSAARATSAMSSASTNGSLTLPAGSATSPLST
jgi:DNA-binding transcriptional LysR family regulator